MNQPANEKSFSEMGILEHLHELRKRLIRSLLAIFILGIASYSFCDPLFVWLCAPFKEAFPNDPLVGTSPADAIVIKITVSFFAGALLALPIVFHEVWKFISPGLYESEKKWVIPFILLTTLCFVAGVLFCYYEILPVSFRFFQEQYLSIELKPQVTLSSHLQLTLQCLVAFGLIFELPILSFCLARLGMLSYETILGGFRYIIVAIFIAAAVLSPPDVISQMLMAIPMLVLYGISILVVRFTEKKSQGS